ncbi:Hsp70 family protein [bacterium]|nr:Hsp70 family protein [bacterium]
MATNIVGIDLGTTNTVMAIMDGDTPVIIPNSLGERLTPSVVSFGADGEILVGKKARRAMILNPQNTVGSIKRHMGTNYRVEIYGRKYTPQEISAIIMQKIKSDLESYLGHEVPQAVVTVPAYFTDAQRQATRDAGEIAGFNVRRIIDEPTAAAISYGFDRMEEDQILMIYDLGGGTFDVSIIEVVNGVFQVLAIKGDNMLGGDDFDQRIVDWLVEEFKQREGIDLTTDPSALQKLRIHAEEAKIELSNVERTNILIESVIVTDKGPLTLDMDITRARLESLIGDLVEGTERHVRAALEDAGLKSKDITNVVLVGGSTRIPMVQKLVEKIIGRPARRDINPEECVALGAAVQSSLIASLDEEMQHSAADRLPEKGPVVVHLTPFSLGVGLVGDQYGVLVPKNSTYPTEAKDIFTTTRDFQTAISFPVYEGEEAIASSNTFLDMLRIDDIAPAPRGIPRVEVTFRLNHDRILEATAKDLTTAKAVTITVMATDNRLSPEEKARAIKEAQNRITSMLEDRMQDALMNQAEALIYRAERLLSEVDSPPRGIHETIEELQNAIERRDGHRISGAMEHLTSMITQMER